MGTTATKDMLLRARFQDEASSKIQKLEGLTSGVGSAIGTVVKGIGLAVTAVVGATVAVSVPLAKAGGDLERLEVATKVLGNNMGVSAKQIDKMVKGLEDVNTYGTNAYESIYAFIRTGLLPMVQNLEVLDKTTGKTTKGFDAFILSAKDLGASMGVSSDQAIKAVTTSLVKMNDEGLRQLGIDVNLTYEYAKMAKSLGVTSMELTDAQRKQVLLNVVMREGAKVSGTYSATYETLGKQVLSIGSNFKSTVEVLGRYLQPVFKVFTKTALDLVKSVREFFIDNADTISAWAEKVGAFLAKFINAENIISTLKKGKQAFSDFVNSDAVQGLIKLSNATGKGFKSTFEVIGKVFNDILKPAIAEMAKAWAEMAKSMGMEGNVSTAEALGKAIGYLVAGVLLVIVLFVKLSTLLYKLYTDYIKKFSDGIMQIKEAPAKVSEAWGKMVDFMKTTVDNIKNFFVTTWNGIVNFFSTTVDKIKTFFSNTWNAIVTIVPLLPQIIAMALGMAVAKIIEFFMLLPQRISEAWDNIKKTASDLWEGLKVMAFNALVSIGLFFIDLGLKAIQMWEGMKSTGRSAIDNLVAFFVSIPSRISGVWENIKSGFKVAVDNIKDWFTKDVPDAITKGFNKVKDFIKGIPDALKGAMNSIIEKIEKTINAFVTGYNEVAKKSSVLKPIESVDLPRLATGTNYVPQDMLAIIHKGEAVVPAKYNPNNPASNASPSNNVTININAPVYGINDLKSSIFKALDEYEIRKNTLANFNLN